MIKSATRRYALVSFLVWLPVGLYAAPMVLLTLSRGLDLAGVAAIGAAYSLTVAILELPTGGLADVIGRRPVLVASAVISAAGLVLLGLSTTAAGLVAAAVLRGVARALSTGPAEAWYVDTVHAAGGPDADLGPGLARGAASASATLAVGMLAGGLLPVVVGGPIGPVVPLALPVLLGAVGEIVRVVVTIRALPEPPRSTGGGPRPGVFTTVRTGLRLGLRDPVVSRLLVIAAAIGATLATIELITPAWLGRATGDAETGGLAYALVAAAGFVADGLGSTASHRVARRLGSPRSGAIAGLLLAVAALAGLAAATQLPGAGGVLLAGAAYCGIFVGIGISVPVQARLLHSRVGAGERATVVSVQSLLMQITGAVAAVALGALATGTAPGLAVLAVAIVLGLSLTLLRHRPEVRPVQDHR